MFRIGNQTSCHSENILDPFEFAIKYGFEAFEWFFDVNEDGRGLAIKRTDAYFRSSIKQRAQEAGINLSVHAPCTISPYTDEGMRTLHAIIGFSIDIQASVLVLHFDQSRGTMNFLTKIYDIAKILSNTNIILAIENTPYTGPGEFNQFFLYMPAHKKKRIGMAFDLGHANLYSDFRNDYVGYLKALESFVPICHLHFHENSGEEDSHHCIFTTHSRTNDEGIRSVIKNLTKRDLSANLILEQWPQPRKLLLDARSRLRKIIDQEKID